MTIKELFGHAIGVAKFPDFAKFYNWFTKRNHTLKGDITFEGGVDMSNASLVGLPPAYATEIEAIDAGLAFGDKYVDSDGVVQTVTKIKQTITLPAGVQTMFGFLIDLDTLPSKDILDVLPTYIGSLSAINNGLLEIFNTAQNPVFNTLTAFTNGRGYIANPTASFSYSVYGPPLNSGYHTNLTTGNNIVVHNAETTSAASATSWIGITLSSVATYVNGAFVTNPATWNKGQGYLIAVADGSQAEIGSPSTPVPVDITGEQIVDLLIAENYDSRPYKVYTALLTQTGTDAPVPIILENTIGNIVWTRTGAGVYVGTLAGAFVTNKTFVEAKTIFDDVGQLTRITVNHTTDAITITNFGGIDFTWPGAMINGTYPIEIRVYN